MPLAVTINGQSYTIPQTGDLNWGDNTTTILQDTLNRATGVHNVLIFDADNTGATDTYTEVMAAITQATISGGIVYFPPGTYKLGTNLTVPSDVTLWLADGAKLYKLATTEVVINGSLIAPYSQIFENFAAGDVTFGAGTTTPRVTSVHPEWWGAIGNGATDSATAINSAVQSLGVGGRGLGNVIRFLAGHYEIQSTIDFTGITSGGFTVEGSGKTSTVLQINGAVTTGFDFTYTATTNAVTLRNFSLDGAKGAAQVGMDFAKCYNFLLENVQVSDMGTLLRIDGGGDFQLENCTFNFNDNNASGSIALDLDSAAKTSAHRCFFLAEGTNPDNLECINVDGSANTFRKLFVTDCHMIGRWNYGINIAATANVEHLIASNNSFQSQTASWTTESFVYGATGCIVSSGCITNNIIQRHATGNSGTVAINLDGGFTDLAIGGNIINGFETDYDTSGLAGVSGITVANEIPIVQEISATPTQSINLLAGYNIHLTLTQDTALTLNNEVKGVRYLFQVIQDATGGWDITNWATGDTVKWANDTAPSISAMGASDIKIVTLYYDGTRFLGNYSEDFTLP